MRFFDEYIKLRINAIDGEKKTKHEFRAFITNISETIKPTFVAIDNKVIPTSRNQYLQKYYMDINIELDLLAEDEVEMKTNYASIKQIIRHMTKNIDSTVLESGKLLKDVLDESVSGENFEIEFNGFLHSGKYSGYLTQFDAKPDMEKGYWYEPDDSLKQMYPKAYKISIKFESTDFLTTEPIYPWRAKKSSGDAGKGPSPDPRLERVIAEAKTKSYASASPAGAIINDLRLSLGTATDIFKPEIYRPSGVGVITKYNEFESGTKTCKEFKDWYESNKQFFVQDSRKFLDNISVK